MGVVGKEATGCTRQKIMFGDKILTPRLVLRRIFLEDLPLISEWSRSEAAHGNFLTPVELDEVQGKDLIRSGMWWNSENRKFIIELKEGPEIGTLHFWVRPECKQCGVVALKISDPEHRNKGYGTEAQKYVIIDLFENQKLGSVEMYTDINNTPQQRCLKKLGFDLIDTLGYDDHQVHRIGHLFRLDATSFSQSQYYKYHYEE